jgi:phthalate 4,5-cis-dihydrodiol dehydrogenase
MVRIGIVGLGRAASGLLPAMHAHPDIEVVALAEPQDELREAFCEDFEVKGYADAAELCESPEVDLVYVATPHQFHCAHAVLAARAGKHVMVEKPMALTLEECDEMIEAARAAQVVLMVGQTNGYDAPVLAMRELTKSGRYGRLRMLSTANYSDFLYRPRRPEELDTELGGGIMYNQFPHQIEMLRVIADSRVERVSASCGIWDPTRPTEGAVAALLNFSDGVVASVIYNGYAHLESRALYEGLDEAPTRPQPPPIRESIAGMSPEAEAVAKARSGYLARRDVLRSSPKPASRHERFGLIVASYEHADVVPTPTGLAAYTDSGVELIPVAFGTGSLSRSTVMDELVAAVAGSPPLHDGIWGRATMAVCLAALESSRQGKEVSLE